MSLTPGQPIYSKPSEADTCRMFVTPKLVAAGWDTEPHSLAEQRTFTAGRIVVAGTIAKRQEAKRADYLLRYTPDFTIAVVEAKPEDALPGDGLQQAKDYAETLGLKFAYSTNGLSIVEFDYLTGIERQLDRFPTPNELWSRLSAGESLSPEQGQRLLSPSNTYAGKTPRYYQEIAINRAMGAILKGQRRNLLTMATGTGKTCVAFQICWKLWSSAWNRDGRFGKPRILFLADRNILVDDPKDKDFLPFADARMKIEGGVANKSRQMYFALYQSIAKDEDRPGLYKEFGREFFDLIVIDECHRGSAADDSNWREILEYFEPAYQLGMTATPLRKDNKDTYEYFGAPLYTYSLRQGIEDGFLAPYRVHRILTTVDAVGWRPEAGQVDEQGNEIPDQLYTTPNFEADLVLRKRTDAIAHHITNFIKEDPYAKTILFCVDQEHAENMRAALSKANPDLMKKCPDYVCRIVSDEGDIGKGHLGRFKDVETISPVIATTSQMLTTGVDVPTCRNVAIVRNIGSMTEFKQIIGRGTRVRDDYGKLYFNILDYTGAATRLFADPDFDGDPVFVKRIDIDDEGETTGEVTEAITEEGFDEGTAETETGDGHKDIVDTGPKGPKKYYVDGGGVEIAANVVFDLDADGKRLRMVKLTEYAGEKVKTLWRTPEELRDAWLDSERRGEIITELAKRGIDLETLADAARLPDADPFDLLCHLAFNAPVRTRKDRAAKLRDDPSAFLGQYGKEAREILSAMLDKYADHGTAQFAIPEILEVPPISQYGNVLEIANYFGGVQQLRSAVNEMQRRLYAA
ncbi:MAG: DEAD/DEAH box helicase family protein [Candidatus Solibacter usitatus]|nr:DEAD/DEAH box helicase family protein [Candidatus Solibacter usitatus]